MKSIDAIAASANDIYSTEEYFHRMLILERLRSPKTGKPFMVIFLDIEKLAKGKRAEKAFVLRRLMALLKSSPRKIDVKGWYIFDSIIGIICKEVEENRRNRVTGKRKDILYEEGVFHLIGNAADAVKLLCFLYPDQLL